MLRFQDFTQEEVHVLTRIQNYFSNDNMNFTEKLLVANLIAQHELDSYQFNNERERVTIVQFKEIIEQILKKL